MGKEEADTEGGCENKLTLTAQKRESYLTLHKSRDAGPKKIVPSHTLSTQVFSCWGAWPRSDSVV